MLIDKISTLPLTPPTVVQSGASVSQVVDKIQAGAVGCVVVCQGDKLIGILTERDVLIKVVARDVDYKTPVDEFMTPDPVTLPSSATIGDAVAIMVEKNFRHLPITEAGKAGPIAVVSIKDVIALVAESFPAHVLNLPPRPHQKMATREGA
jgi:signal-transduction protein with cAMP-binding, CBS, and nucleotidyltransferase domain